MGLSKSQSIQILLAIDVVFFLLEISVGYAVHSLALVADSFHMLNDVLSLLVGLWAVKVAQQKERTNMYTYGWQRAETVGALVNGVFLVALCLSIVLEAIQRFVEPQEVSRPKLVLIVGCFGLASNILGLLLFHEHGHGHSHGGHSHSHEHTDIHSAAEEGHVHVHGDASEADAERNADEDGQPVDVPETAVLANGKPTIIVNDGKLPDHPAPPRRSIRRPSRSRSRGYSNLDEIYVHPASFRSEIIAAARGENNIESPTDTDTDDVRSMPSEDSPLIKKNMLNGSDDSKSNKKSKKPNDWHKGHKHSKPKKKDGHGHGHSHGDLNMRGVFLHVLGDALGNIGVIASALLIWLTDFWWRFYADPAISLIITIIILTTAIPLCKAASRILLQAVPAGISIDDLRDDIEELPGIISAHHIHVWQLSDTKFVASLHVQVGFDFKDQGSARYMDLARAIRKCLHDYGIHSSTIQPEFCLETSELDPAHAPDYSSADESDHPTAPPVVAEASSKKSSSKASSILNTTAAPAACLLECGDECGDAQQCCAPSSAMSRQGSDHGN